MDVQEAENRLRLLSRTIESSTGGERENKLRQEIKSILNQAPKAEHMLLLQSLARAFPVWPPDVPPPAPPTDEEMIEKLRMRCDASDATRRQIEAALREAGLGGSLSIAEAVTIAQKAGLDTGIEPPVGRVVDAFLLMLDALSNIDQAIRSFLHHYGLGVLGLQVPRFRETAIRLLMLPDDNAARHAEHAKLENSCSLLERMAALLVQWPEDLAGRLAAKYAPSAIEAVAQKSFLGGVKSDSAWAEYQKRLSGVRDTEAVKGEFLDLFKRIINETANK